MSVSVAAATKAAKDVAVKPVSKVLDAVADRISARIRARKPKLNVVFNPRQCLWTVGGELQKDGTFKEIMSIWFWADFAHDNPGEHLVITEAYVSGTQQKFGTFKTGIPAGRITTEMVMMSLVPIKGKRGQPFSSRIILRDQFGRKYKTKEASFRWVESPLPKKND